MLVFTFFVIFVVAAACFLFMRQAIRDHINRQQYRQIFSFSSTYSTETTLLPTTRIQQSVLRDLYNRSLRKLQAIIDEKDAQVDTSNCYSQGLEEFHKFFNDFEPQFEYLQHSNDRVVLELCHSADEDVEQATVAFNNNFTVRYNVDLSGASLFHIACYLLDLNRPFAVQGFNGRKIVNTDLIQAENGTLTTLSIITNSPLGLSKYCRCGISRPSEPDCEVEENITATIVLRLAVSVAKYLPCPCGTDDRVNERERFDMFCRTVHCICQRLVDIEGSLPRSEEDGFSNFTYSNVHVQYEHRTGLLETENNDKSSFGKAVEIIVRMYNIYVTASERNDVEEVIVPRHFVKDQLLIEKYCAELSEQWGVHAALNWLCYNKWNREHTDDVKDVLLPMHTELKLALRFMDGGNIETVGRRHIGQLMACRIPLGTNLTETVLPHRGGSARRVPPLREPVFHTVHNFFCMERGRLEDFPSILETEVIANIGKDKVTISITREGSVISFKKRTKAVKKFLRGFRSVQVLGSGIAYDVKDVLGDDLYASEYHIVNDALEMKYGVEVFNFVFSKLMTNEIAVHKDSPAASFVPKACKKDDGVMISTMITPWFWADKTFIMTESSLYWLPKDGYNYFKVVRRSGDGVLTMRECEELDGAALYKCSAKLDSEIG